MREIVLEVCVEGIAACIAARDGGAARLEVCSSLNVGGLTPEASLVREAMRQTGLPVHVMIRPRAGNFVYSGDEFAAMLRRIDEAKLLGAAGVVFGLLHADYSVDVERTRRLVERALPVQVTFHRAFDACVDLDAALEDVIATGCDRLLTSGGAPDVVAGASSLARLVQRAGERLAIAVGGGLRLRDAAHVARVTGATHFHGSMTEGTPGRVDVASVRRMVELLREA